jgi:hypothetical protein
MIETRKQAEEYLTYAQDNDPSQERLAALYVNLPALRRLHRAARVHGVRVAGFRNCDTK